MKMNGFEHCIRAYILVTSIVGTAWCNGQYNGCIFGSTDSCYFECKCEGGTCDSVSGTCSENNRCSQPDSLLADYYPQGYLNGAACQVGNLAYNKKAQFTDPYENPSRHITTHRGFIKNEFSDLHFYSQRETFVIILDELSSVIFIDIFLHPDVNLSSLHTNLIVSLDTEVMKSSNEVACTVETNPFDLLKSLPYGIKRLQYKCEPPSTGSVIRIAVKSDVSLPYVLSVARFVAMGHRFVDVDRESCLQAAGDEIFGWCRVCSGGYPPDCKTKCPTGKWGKNCKETCSEHCVEDGKCNAIDGSCVCPGGPCPSSRTPTTEQLVVTETPTTQIIVERKSTQNVLTTPKLLTRKSTGTPTIETLVDIITTASNTKGDPTGNVIIDNNASPPDLMKVIVIILVTVLVLMLIGGIAGICYCKCKNYKHTSQPLRFGTGHGVRYTRNSPMQETLVINETYEEIPADQVNNHNKSSTSSHDESSESRYVEAPINMESIANLPSAYLRAGQVDRDTYLEPRQISDGSTGNGLPPTTGNQGYEPLQQTDGQQPYDELY